MKPQARIQAVIELLEKVYHGRIPMDAVCGDYMRARRYIGSKDRAFIADCVYDLMRHHARLGWWNAHMKLPDLPRLRVIIYLILVRNFPASRLKDLFDGSSYAPEKLKESELELIKKLEGKTIDTPDMPEDILAECPLKYARSLKNYFGDSFKEEMNALIGSAPLDLRVNIYTAKREDIAASLEKDGVKTEPTPYSPTGLRCLEKAYLSKTKAFHKGWVEIQDEGSQMIAHVCQAGPGMQVLDYCAGGGGKTLALAASMRKKGRIVAMDMDSKRLEKGRLRYKKAGLADIIEVRPLDDEKHRKWLRRQKDKFDVVLLDVPCSGTGTWRRNPDMRWKQIGPDLEELKTIQAEILERAHKTVKPGGILVYATCSLLPEENEQQIEAFLKANAEFSIDPPDEFNGIGSPFMRLTPYRHNTDGFLRPV